MAPVAYGVARRSGNGRVALGRRVLENSSPRAGLLAALAGALAVLALLSCSASAAMAATGGADKLVRYRGYTAVVPASWPVYDLRSHPSVCVRFDHHAVYLGQPR